MGVMWVSPTATVGVYIDAKTASLDSQIPSDAFVAAIAEAGYQASFKKSCCSHVG